MLIPIPEHVLRLDLLKIGIEIPVRTAVLFHAVDKRVHNLLVFAHIVPRFNEVRNRFDPFRNVGIVIKMQGIPRLVTKPQRVHSPALLKPFFDAAKAYIAVADIYAPPKLIRQAYFIQPNIFHMISPARTATANSICFSLSLYFPSSSGPQLPDPTPDIA